MSGPVSELAESLHPNALACIANMRDKEKMALEKVATSARDAASADGHFSQSVPLLRDPRVSALSEAGSDRGILPPSKSPKHSPNSSPHNSPRARRRRRPSGGNLEPPKQN